MNIKQELLEVISKQLKEPIMLESPPSPIMGDFALPTFKLTKKPQELQKTLKLPQFIEKTEIKGPYLNFFIKKDYLAEKVINEVLKQKDKYGSSNAGRGKRVLVEHTSINPNASPHMGRARNAIIGDSIVSLLRFQGYKVETHYYVNDIGKQIAMLVLACKNKTPSFKELLNLYVNFNKELEAKPQLEKEVFALLNRLEKGDKLIIDAFRKVVDICIKGQEQILNELNIKFDYFDYESTFLFNKETEIILKELKNTNRLFKDEEGRTAINLEGFNLPMENPYLPITRNDGTSLYILRDIAYTIYKEKKGKDRNILVLGEDQKLYFLQLKAILSLINHKAPEPVHYSYILLPTGKMSTRKGDVVLLEDFMSDIRKKAEEEIIARHGKVDNIENLSKIIGYGAVKFTILKVSPDKNITFEIEKALSFEGETAPYIQYACARANSIINKAKPEKKIDYSLLTTPNEQIVLAKISNFQQIADSASASLQPHIIANYTLDLAKVFNEFYHACPVISAEEPLKSARLNLVLATRQTLTNALSLLGIEAPEQM